MSTMYTHFIRKSTVDNGTRCMWKATAPQWEHNSPRIFPNPFVPLMTSVIFEIYLVYFGHGILPPRPMNRSFACQNTALSKHIMRMGYLRAGVYTLSVQQTPMVFMYSCSLLVAEVDPLERSIFARQLVSRFVPIQRRSKVSFRDESEQIEPSNWCLLIYSNRKTFFL